MLEIFFRSRYSRKWLFACPIHARDSGVREIFAYQSAIWEILLVESGIPLTIGIQNPRFSPTKQSGIYGVESGIQVCLGFPYVGRVFSTATYKVLLMQDLLKVSNPRKHSITRLTFLFTSKS